jgi:hypothetical protein
VEEGKILLQAAVGGRGGMPPVIRASAHAAFNQGDEIVEKVFNSLVEQGALKLLAE